MYNGGMSRRVSTKKKGAIVLSFIGVMAVGLFGYSQVGALTYSSDTDLSFTFNPVLGVSLSSSDLHIDDLAPGTSADSNIITVSVNTNTAYGYTLNATVGQATNYETRNLVLDGDNSYNFTSINYGASLASLTTDNTWGYAYLPSTSGASWTNYSGLPLYSDTTNVANLISTDEPADNSSVQFKIAAKASSGQASGEYKNVINFIAVANPEPVFYLYDEVAKMSKGTQSPYELLEEITTPTTDDYLTDTSNSGVFLYDEETYGPSSDASDIYDIYYYRGVLEGTGDHGQYGSSATYPNYVKLDNGTCWRIVRTTGSGGVKMIFNGFYGEAVPWGEIPACKNYYYDLTENLIHFNSTSPIRGYVSLISENNLASVGYTYNPDVANVSGQMALAEILGSDGFDNNVSDSVVKQYIDDWYEDYLLDYTGLLETSAGFCNDRSIYLYETNNQSLGGDYLLDQYEVVSPSINVSPFNKYHFGSYLRASDVNNGLVPRLGCPRGDVDLYTTASSNDGNKHLTYPVALLTADESILAGLRFGGADANNDSIYLRDGFLYSLSPSSNSLGSMSIFNMAVPTGSIHNDMLAGGNFWALPSVSLIHEIEVAGGTGTATDPWTIR